MVRPERFHDDDRETGSSTGRNLSLLPALGGRKGDVGQVRLREIVAPERIVLVNSFSDEKGGLTRHPSVRPALEMLSQTTLVEEDAKTKLTIEWSALNPTDEERKTFDSRTTA